MAKTVKTADLAKFMERLDGIAADLRRKGEAIEEATDFMRGMTDDRTDGERASDEADKDQCSYMPRRRFTK